MLPTAPFEVHFYMHVYTDTYVCIYKDTHTSTI